jgi:hypothetical protein
MDFARSNARARTGTGARARARARCRCRSRPAGTETGRCHAGTRGTRAETRRCARPRCHCTGETRGSRAYRDASCGCHSPRTGGKARRSRSDAGTGDEAGDSRAHCETRGSGNARQAGSPCSRREKPCFRQLSGETSRNRASEARARRKTGRDSSGKSSARPRQGSRPRARPGGRQG